MRIAVPPSKLEDSQAIRELTAAYLARGGVITYLNPGDYTPIAGKIYNPHVDHSAQPKKQAKYYDAPAA